MPELDIDKDLMSEIVEQVTKSVDIESIVSKAVTDASEKTAEAVIAKLDTPAVKKDIADKEAAGDASDGKKATKVEDPIEKMSPQLRFFKAAQALSNGDINALKQYNQVSMKKIAENISKEMGITVEKAVGYANEGTAADGLVLVPDPEFNTVVYNNLPQYGVSWKYANVRQTDRTAVYALSLDAGLSFYATAEAGVKTGAKLAFSRKLTSLLKYAVIVPATDELTDDAIVDYWNIVTNELSRAYGLLGDQIVFTDASAGILHTTGIITQPVSGNGTTVTWDDLLKSEGAVEDGLDTSSFRWYMRKETYMRLAITKSAGSGEYLWESYLPNPNHPVTPWGTEIVFTRVLPKTTEVSANGGFAVFGDLSNYLLYQRRGMEIKMLTEAVVKDSLGADFNLATQDGTAMRAVVRLLGILPKGNAGKFVVVGTGSVS